MTSTLEADQPVEAAETPLEELTGHDRCDRCGAQAYVRVVLFSGLDLLFCAHHYKQHEMTLDHYSLRVQDESDRLLDTATGPEVR